MKKQLSKLLILFLVLAVQTVFAQTKTITGTVTDDNGMPLPGVNIVVKNSSQGTQTDFDGNFSIAASEGDILTFSYIGFAPQEVAVGIGNRMDVEMAAGEALEEIVVLGYSSTRKTELTGSTVQVESEQIEQVPVASVDQVLQGKVAGLVFNNNSGTPGSASDIRIRGISSITAGNEPLYVIDGVPVVNSDVSVAASGSSLSPLSSINSNNIASITVLKDASATAAYGARGSNGVIVITTKSGTAGKTSFNFSSSFGFSNDATHGPNVLTGAEREMLFYEAIYNTYGESNGFTEAGARDFYEANPTTFGTDYVTWNAAGRPEANWEDYITNDDAPVYEYNLSASGGGDTYNFFTSIGYFKQEATVIGSDFDRISGSLNFTKNLTEKLRFNTLNQASYSYQDGLLETSAYFSSPRTVKYFMPPIDQPYTADGELNTDISLPNPIYISQNDIDDSKLTRIITNNSLDWETPITGLTATSRISIDLQVYNYKRYRNRIEGDGAGSDGSGQVANTNRANYVFQNSLNYTWNINDEQSIDFTALQEYQKNRFNYLQATADAFSDDGLTNLNSAGNPTSANSYYNDWSVASYLGLVHYSGFNGKYIIDGTYRREGNSRFGQDNRWGDFGSVGVAWNIFKEDFVKDMGFINNLKIRGSYGVTGNANIDLNQYQALLNYDSDYAGEGASYPGTFGNSDLSWETSHTLDVGIEFGILQNRISGSVAYYRRESKDLLLDVPLSLTTGFDEQTRNIGSMENKGFEFELNTNIIQSEDFNLSIGGNLATNKNEVLELATDANGNEINITTQTQRVETGHPVYGWYMPTWAGVDPENGDELYYTDGEGSATTNNFNDAESEWQGGSAIPKITAGLNFHVDYIGFFLDANAYYSGGSKVYEEWHRYTNAIDLYSLLYYQGVDAILDRWQEPGDVTRFGRVQATTFPWQRHSKFLYDGDFMRIKNITFGYNFKGELIETIGLTSARVFLRGTNMFTWVKDDNLKYDPETAADGFTRLTTPPVKSLIFGINLKF